MAEREGSYQFFDHAADVGISVRACSPAALFRTAAGALMAWIGPVPEGRAAPPQDIRIHSGDLEELLVRWLQELIYQFQCRRLYVTEVPRLRISQTDLQAELAGIILDDNARSDFREVKAATYHQLSVRQEGETWTANVILDV